MHMGIFKRKRRPTQEELREQSVQQRRMQALQKLRAFMDTDPSFQLCTFDGLSWIDPFSGSLVPAPFNYKAAAMKHLQEHEHWRGAHPKPILELRQVQWYHYLQENFDSDARFHFFAKQGNWLNPFNGEVSAGVIKQEGITPVILQNMARVLASYDDATPDSLLSAEELSHRHPSLSPFYDGVAGEVGDDLISADELDKLDGWEDLGSEGNLFAAADDSHSHSHSPSLEESNGAGSTDGGNPTEETRLYERPGVPPETGSSTRTGPPPPPPRPAEHRERRGRDDRAERDDQGKQDVRGERDARPRRHERHGSETTTSGRHASDPESGRRTAPLSTAHYREVKDTRRRRSRRSASHRDGEPTTKSHGTTTARILAERSSFHDLYAPPEQLHQETDDLEQARAVQHHLMGNIPDLDGIEFGLHFEPYRYIGGDFYDFVRISDKQLFFIVGDVSGHGTQAALVVGSILKSIRHLLLDMSTFDLVDILCHLNDDVRNDLIAGQFFTAFVGILDLSEKRRMQGICAGHHPCICLNPNGPTYMRRVGKNGMALGMTEGAIFRRQLKVVAEHFIPGDTLCIYTDGVQEAMNKQGTEFGHWGARASFCRHIELPANELTERVAHEASAYADGKPQDDMTVMAIRFT